MKSTIFSKLAIMSLLVLPFGVSLTAHAAEVPTWNATGNYTIAVNYLGTDYEHSMTLTQNNAGSITGFGGSPVVSPVYTWVITSGDMQNNIIDIHANYTATADAVTPQTAFHITGTVATSGVMSGTWSDNYQGGNRSGTWTASAGVATPIGTLSAEDFGVVSYDTGLGILKGYTAGFGLTDATFAGAQSVVVKLYSSSTLLQTNVATSKVATEVIGNQISSPFDVLGTFAYATDGYWTNTRETEYGKKLPATRVVATVVLSNGKVVTAVNNALVGDTSTITGTTTSGTTTPPVVSTTTPTSKNECKNKGWKTFTQPSFRNQGQCIAFVEHATHLDDDDEDEDVNGDCDNRNHRNFKAKKNNDHKEKWNHKTNRHNRRG